METPKKSAAPSSSRAKVALQRLRNARAQSALSSSIDESPGVGTPSDKRRELSEMRRRARGQSFDGDQSRLRLSPSRRSLDSDAGIGALDAEDDDEEEENRDDIEENIELKAIGGVEEPLHVFPLIFLPTWRSSEAVKQPLVIFPEPRPSARRACQVCAQGFAHTCAACVSSFGHSIQVRDTDELGLLCSGDVDLNGIGNIRGDRDDEHSKLLSSEELNGTAYRSDGIYTSDMPLLTQIMLAGEKAHVDSLDTGGFVAASLSSGINLSRITQRVLRELKGALEADKLRAIWKEEMRAIGGEANRRRARDESKSADRLQEEITRGLPGVSLLAKVQGGAAVVLRVPETPVSEQLVQPFVPDAARAYGGVLGQWESDASQKEKLGPLPSRIDTKRPPRATMRIHLHALSLTSHPLMNDEERLYVELKKAYCQYSSVFEQRSTGYLSYRLCSLIVELTRLLNTIDAAEREDDSDASVSSFAATLRLYSDLIATLPALYSLRRTIDELAETIQQKWDALSATRQVQGYFSTNAEIRIRKVADLSGSAVVEEPAGEDGQQQRQQQRSVRSKRGGVREEPWDAASATSSLKVDTADSIAADSISLGHLVQEQSDWGAFKIILQTVPSVVRSVHDLIRRSKNNSNSGGGQATTSSQEQPSPMRSRANSASERPPLLSSKESSFAADPALLVSPKAVRRGRSSLLQRSRQGSIAVTASLPDDLRLLEVEKIIGESVEGLLKLKGLLPDKVYRLSDVEGLCTLDSQVDAREKARRRAVATMKFKAVIRINGQVVSSTPYANLHISTLGAEFKKYFEFRVIHRPSTITVDLFAKYTASMLETEKLVAVIPIQQPGGTGSHRPKRRILGTEGLMGMDGGGRDHAGQISTHAFAPVTSWFEFHSTSSVKLSLFNKGTVAVGASAGVFCCEKPELHEGNLEGAVLCTTEYDIATIEYYVHQQRLREESNQFSSIPSEDIAFMPETRPGSNHSPLISLVGHKPGDAAEVIGEGGVTDVNALDLNDPANAALLVQKFQGPKTDRHVFQLAGLDFAVPFIEDGESYLSYLKYQLSVRMQLIRLRDIKPYLFTEPIPLSEKAIQGSKVYKLMLAKHSSEATHILQDGEPITEAGDEDTDDDEVAAMIDQANKVKITNFLQRVRNSNAALDRRSKKRTMATSSVMVETNYFIFESIFDFDEITVFNRRRSLKPTAKPRLPVALRIDRCNVLVQVVGARNIPLRVELDRDGLSSRANRRIDSGAGVDNGTNDAGSALRASRLAVGGDGLARALADVERAGVRGGTAILDEAKAREAGRAKTFVEVNFQEHRISTYSTAGGAPLWKQSMTAPLRPPQEDFSLDNLRQLQDEITFTLFDEVLEDDSSFGGFLEGESTHRNERRFLGSFSLPFITVLREQRIEGTFRLKTPPFVMGYNYSHQEVVQSALSNGRDDLRQQQQRENAAPAGVLGWLGLSNNGSTEPGISSPADVFSTVIGSIGRFFNRFDNTERERKAQDVLDSSALIHPETKAEFEYFASGVSSTVVKVMVTLDPLIVSPLEIDAEINVSTTCKQDRYLAKYAQLWLQAVKAHSHETRGRNYSIFGTNSSGYKVLVPRFLVPMKPPAGFTTRRSVVHLVSQFPYLADAQAFVGSFDLWCTAKQTWDIGAGDEEEHGVLLYNYLYYLMSSQVSYLGGESRGYPSDEYVKNESLFLVLGRGIPEGNTVYVLLRDVRRKHSSYNRKGAEAWYAADFYLLINPCTGHIFSADDPSAPLHEILCLATPYNIWANIQPTTRPADVIYDVMNPRLWRPFFGSEMPSPLGGLKSVQEDFQFAAASDIYALQIEQQLRQSIKSQLRRWRSKRYRSTTTFHPDACAIMHDMLPKLENWCRNGDASYGDFGEEIIASARGQADSDEEGVAAGSRDRDRQRQREERLKAAVEESRRGRGGGLGGRKMGLDDLQEELRVQMKSIFRTRTLHGFPLNIPYSDIDDVLKKIKATSVHESKHPEAQFVVAVRVFPIAHKVVSLWVFIGTLEARAETNNFSRRTGTL